MAKYYAIRNGRRIGVFDEWFGPNGCEAQVKGYPGAIYKSFKTYDQALNWLRAELPSWAKKMGQKREKRHRRNEKLLRPKRTNPLGLTRFYNGKIPPWEFEGGYIWDEDMRYQSWLCTNAFV